MGSLVAAAIRKECERWADEKLATVRAARAATQAVHGQESIDAGL
jgi:hypothetical protein